MKIKLKEPYSSLYEVGYLLTSKSGRKYVTFARGGVVITTTSYARYKLSVAFGVIIPADLEVDHIDNDRTNDRLSNLQAISGIDNRAKHTYDRPSLKVHGSLACYRYCKCSLCKLGKSLYSAGKISEYRKLIGK